MPALHARLRAPRELSVFTVTRRVEENGGGRAGKGPQAVWGIGLGEIENICGWCERRRDGNARHQEGTLRAKAFPRAVTLEEAMLDLAANDPRIKTYLKDLQRLKGQAPELLDELVRRDTNAERSGGR